MNQQFRRGKQLVTLVIAIMLITNGVSFWFSRSLLLSWYQEAADHFHTLDATQAQRLLDYFVQLDQREFLVAQGTDYAFLILCSVILYLGYSWIRWLWSVTWLVKGGAGLFVAGLLMTQFGLWANLVLFGLITSSLYLLCAICILFLPSVHTYMKMMRR
jgi:hypothetical protein